MAQMSGLGCSPDELKISIVARTADFPKTSATIRQENRKRANQEKIGPYQGSSKRFAWNAKRGQRLNVRPGAINP